MGHTSAGRAGGDAGRRAGAAALVLAVLLAGCRRSPAGPPPERFLPAAPAFALVVPDLARAAHELDALYQSAATFPGAGGVVAGRESLRAQLGFDPFDPRALEDAGVEPSRGLAAGVELHAGRPEEVLVLPVADGPRLEERLQRIAADRLGATVRTAETHEGRAVVVLRTAAGAPPAFAYTVAASDRTAVAAWGPTSPDAVARAAVRPATESLAGAEEWKAARAALGEHHTLLAYSPRGTPLPLSGLVGPHAATAVRSLAATV